MLGLHHGVWYVGVYGCMDVGTLERIEKECIERLEVGIDGVYDIVSFHMGCHLRNMRIHTHKQTHIHTEKNN